MKIRQGFVANSSTSSFIVMGWSISEEDMSKLCKNLGFDITGLDGYGRDIVDLDRIIVNGVRETLVTYPEDTSYFVGISLYSGMSFSKISNFIQELKELYPVFVEKEPKLIVKTTYD